MIEFKTSEILDDFLYRIENLIEKSPGGDQPNIISSCFVKRSQGLRLASIPRASIKRSICNMPVLP